MEKLLKDIIKNKKTCYFISPHLDDAAFSCGGLISYLAKRTKVNVITVFSEAGKEKHSLSALAYVKKCGYSVTRIKRFYSLRRLEDKKALELVGAKVIHLGFIDALWRVSTNPNIIFKILSLFLNDFRYIYPTFRWHIAKGKIFKDDKINLIKVGDKLKEIISDDRNSIVFCPIAVGNHVDHVFVREVCKENFGKVVYWQDSPYNLYHDLNLDFVNDNNLVLCEFSKNQVVRKALYPAYKTQYKKLFKGEDFSLPTEKYYLLKI
jgi:LmbE family N-acetylglucosaminyl deacetylase